MSSDDLYVESLESAVKIAQGDRNLRAEECRVLKNKLHYMRISLKHVRYQRDTVTARCERQAEEIREHKMNLARMRDERNEALAVISKLEKTA